MSTHPHDAEANRAIALDFYKKAIINWDYEAASVHIGERYVQHSPTVADGRDGVRQFVEGVPPPVKAMLKTEIRRVLADGDLVAIHSVNTMPGSKGRVIVDLFRLEGGKIVEHWDVVQDMPETALHDNGMA